MRLVEMHLNPITVLVIRYHILNFFGTIIPKLLALSFFFSVPAKANPPFQLRTIFSNELRMRWDPVNEGLVQKTYNITLRDTFNRGIYKGRTFFTSYRQFLLNSDTGYIVTITAINVAGSGETSDEVTMFTGNVIHFAAYCVGMFKKGCK